MTPIIFISFLVSLALVDIRHSALRAHYHADDPAQQRLPHWLHRIMYRYRGYRYDVVVDGQGDGRSVGEGQGQVDGGDDDGSGRVRMRRQESGKGGEEYYHSKQRKLMKMEAAEAFEIRGWVTVALGLVSLGMVWVAWRVASWVVRML